MSEHDMANDCNIFDEFDAAIDTRSCGSHSPTRTNTIYVLGDSHGKQYSNSIAEDAAQRGFNYKIIWGNACLFPAAIIRLGGAECYEKQSRIQERITRIARDGDIVVIANALWGHFGPRNGYFSPGMKEIVREDALLRYSKEFISFSEDLNRRGVKVVFYTDGVRFPDLRVGHLCKKEWFRPTLPESCYSSKVDHLKLIHKRFPWISEWLGEPNRYIWHASRFQSACNDTVCSGENYKDSNHYSNSEATLVWRKFLDASNLMMDH